MKLTVTPENIFLSPEHSADKIIVGIIDLISSYQSAKLTLSIPDTSQPQVASSVNNLANVISNLSALIKTEMGNKTETTAQV